MRERLKNGPKRGTLLRRGTDNRSLVRGRGPFERLVRALRLDRALLDGGGIWNAIERGCDNQGTQEPAYPEEPSDDALCHPG